jgi:hypothetical protein
MALVGVVGGSLLAASGIAVLLGVIPQGSAWQGIATIPEIIWEAFLGLWLTLQGVQLFPNPRARERGACDRAGLRRRLTGRASDLISDALRCTQIRSKFSSTGG